MKTIGLIISIGYVIPVIFSIIWCWIEYWRHQDEYSLYDLLFKVIYDQYDHPVASDLSYYRYIPIGNFIVMICVITILPICCIAMLIIDSLKNIKVKSNDKNNFE